MSKINCTITENFLRELSRATNNCTNSCLDCTIFNFKLKHPHENCISVLANNPKEIISLVQEWSDAHPLKTRLDDLKEKYPDFLVNTSGCPNIYPCVFGYCGNCLSCLLYDIEDRCESCWNEPVEGGATGK